MITISCIICGEPREVKKCVGHRAKYCLECAEVMRKKNCLEAQIRYQLRNPGNSRGRGNIYGLVKKEQERVKSMEQWVECVCPLRGCKHEILMYWTGKLPARKYCEACKNIIVNIDDPVANGHGVGR